MSMSQPQNRLAQATSPYLRQHADNPVDWWPWGPDAFEEARRRDVPIFLSIGYAACHWCHVMEHECFRDERIARQMNQTCVNIKVDRQERPDVDEIYMLATQMLSGHGGWPMSVFLEPVGLRPFWAATYLPPEPRHGMASFPQVVAGVGRAWRERRADVLAQAEQVADAIREALTRTAAPQSLDSDDLAAVASALLRGVDAVHGGFGQAPKFPQPIWLAFLLDVRHALSEEPARHAADAALTTTLDRMATGGLFDHVGGGFHRYCVDADWRVPHFEKMLCDNALLADVYARAATTFGDRWYGDVSRRTLRYVLERLRLSQGAFAAAEDADAAGREGATYVWHTDELRRLLPRPLAEFALRALRMDGEARFRDPHRPQEPAAHVPALLDRPDRAAQRLGLSEHEFAAHLRQVLDRMRQARQQRPQPRLDDQVLTSWNGLMIGALARAGRLLDEPDFILAGEQAATFVLEHLYRNGELAHAWRDEASDAPPILEDYACLSDGLLALAKINPGRFLPPARELMTAAMARFADLPQGLWYDAAAGRTDLFVRPLSRYDSSTPAAAAVMLANLTAMSRHDPGGPWLDAAVRTAGALAHGIVHAPASAVAAAHAVLHLMSLGEPIRQRLRALGPREIPRPDPVQAPGAPTIPVDVFASQDQIVVGPDRPASLRLAVRIAPGHHVTAAVSDDPHADPFRVIVVGGTGVAVYADYPPGERDGAGPAVYRGTIEIPVVVERTGPWSGRPALAIVVQACSERQCLPTITIPLAVRVHRADGDEPAPA